MSIEQEILVEIAKAVLSFVKANADAIEKKLAPFVQAGETGLQALANKVSPLLGAVVAEAIAYLGSDLPKYEGDAVKWIEATIEAFITKESGS